ncbi:MarR family winged helix-turn-helix transcriptional regulator [Actinomadura atramentaria]|uniref:MarR family winged helix-turn-helix transcriptional regulator n=1 Tax=Actinomadura atramentaria TaxID=1990 RepID=UPI00036CA018|nr:MarR family transcriptional regulator [Actinomadura atramentaria]
MNGIELFLLGRTLMKIGEEAIPTGDVSPGAARGTSHRSVLVVAADVREHPGSAIGEIAARTGFPQSKVSTCVARLREAGSVETAPDPADRRRMLVHPARTVSERVAEVRAAPIDRALAAALGTDDPARLAEVRAALETLHRSLDPSALGRMRGHQSVAPAKDVGAGS